MVPKILLKTASAYCDMISKDEVTLRAERAARAPPIFEICKGKSLLGPHHFLVTQGSIRIGPHQFQKRDDTPVMT